MCFRRRKIGANIPIARLRHTPSQRPGKVTFPMTSSGGRQPDAFDIDPAHPFIAGWRSGADS